MKHLNFLFAIIITSTLLIFGHIPNSQAQDFVGFNTNAWAGVTGIDIQPAIIMGGVYKVDVNVAGASFWTYNNYLRHNPTLLFNWENKKFEPIDFFDPDDYSSGIYEQTRYQLPSVLYDHNYRMAGALTIQARSSVQIEGIGPELGYMFHNEFSDTTYQNKRYTSPGLNMHSLTWGEIGLTGGYMHIIGDSRIKLAARVKFITGLSGFYLEAKDDMNYEILNDSTMNVYNASFAYGHSEETDGGRVKMQANSVGFDLGLKYSFANKYVLGLSLIDWGSFNFAHTAGANDFTLNLSEFRISPTMLENHDALDAILDQNATEEQRAETEFKMLLPTALGIQFHAYLWPAGTFEGGGYQNVYLNVNITRSLMNNSEYRRIKAINTYNLTLGVNTISIAAGMPITFTELDGDLSRAKVGAFIRLGPFIIGTKNFFSNLFAQEINQTDFYTAVKIPGLKPKPDITKGCPKFKKAMKF